MGISSIATLLILCTTLCCPIDSGLWLPQGSKPPFRAGPKQPLEHFCFGKGPGSRGCSEQKKGGKKQNSPSPSLDPWGKDLEASRQVVVPRPHSRHFILNTKSEKLPFQCKLYHSVIGKRIPFMLPKIAESHFNPEYEMSYSKQLIIKKDKTAFHSSNCILHRKKPSQCI